jgi:hypothetical protein
LNCTTHHFDAAANWIEGEFSSILRVKRARNYPVSLCIPEPKQRG